MLSLASVLALMPALGLLAEDKERTVKVDEAAVGATAEKAGIPRGHLMAVVMTESAGIAGYQISGEVLPAIRFEGHIFYRQLIGAQRDEAVANGLASPKPQQIKNPSSQAARYRLLGKAAKINTDAAHESCSWGVGQVMGFHWKTLGFRDVQELVTMAKSGQAGQVGLMVMFIRSAGLLDELVAGEWKPFARGYNGPAYAKNAYDQKLERYARLYGGGDDETVPGLLRMGSKGKRVREIQAFLVRAGYPVKSDGDFGPTTRDAVRAFQRDNKLTVDGKVGPQTEKALSLFRASGTDDPGKMKAFDIPLVRAGGLATIVAGVTPEAIGTAKGALENAASQIVGAGVQSVAMDYLVSGIQVGAALLGVAGVAVALYGWAKAKTTVEA